jgi:hypothetical protein
LPVTQFVKEVPFRASPSLFFFFPSDKEFTICAWLGVFLAGLAVVGFLPTSFTKNVLPRPRSPCLPHRSRIRRGHLRAASRQTRHFENIMTNIACADNMVTVPVEYSRHNRPGPVVHRDRHAVWLRSCIAGHVTLPNRRLVPPGLEERTLRTQVSGQHPVASPARRLPPAPGL